MTSLTEKLQVSSLIANCVTEKRYSPNASYQNCHAFKSTKDFTTNTPSRTLPEIINASIATNRLRTFVLAINGITFTPNYLLPVCWLVLHIKHLKGTHFLREDKTFVWLGCASLSNHYFWTDTEKLF